MDFFNKIKLISGHEESFRFLDSVPFFTFYEAKMERIYYPEISPEYFYVSKKMNGYNPPNQECLFSVAFDFNISGFIVSSFLGAPDFKVSLTIESIYKVRDYYEKKYEDYLRTQSEYKKKTDPPDRFKDDLYLIHDTVLNTLKIGRSRNPKSRLSALQISTANRLELICVSKNIGNFEKNVHDKFKHLRMASEWFQYSDDIINFFNSLNTVAI